MKNNTYFLIHFFFVITVIGCSKTPHIVFVMGDEEYRSEESMPMIAAIAKRELGADITLCYSLDENGYIDPNRTDHIQGLEALESADLMVMFTRFRALPDEERAHITNYVESGKPVVGFRTSTHAFKYKEEKDTSIYKMNDDWPIKLFGQKWITHHGHFDDGRNPLTEVTILPEQENHPILQGVEGFLGYSWLYHVQGGGYELHGDSQPLLKGKAIRSSHAEKGNDDKFPITNPVAWTKSYVAENGTISRVFFTTLGHPYDFKETAMRRLALNGIYWALGKESKIPDKGVNVTLPFTYDPNNSGFGQKFKQNQKPLKI